MSFRFMSLDVWRSARELAVVVARMEVRRRTLRDQLDRACESVVLALAEGLPHDSVRMRRQYFARAKASLAEVAGAADLGAAVGAIDAGEAATVIALASKVRAMTVGLLRVNE